MKLPVAKIKPAKSKVPSVPKSSALVKAQSAAVTNVKKSGNSNGQKITKMPKK